MMQLPRNPLADPAPEPTDTLLSAEPPSDAPVALFAQPTSGTGAAAPRRRLLATILFTDIVGSTRRAQELGDRRWRELLAAHHAVVRRELERCDGREIDNAGDGFLAAFEAPGAAIECAGAIIRGVREIGLEVRAGLHTAECDVLGDRLVGIGVHRAARVAARADAGEVLATNTVRELVPGSEVMFEDRGIHYLKDVGSQHLFAVTPAAAESAAGTGAGGREQSSPAAPAGAAGPQSPGAAHQLRRARG